MGMIQEIQIIGVDGGGSGCRVALYAADAGQPILVRGGPANAFTDRQGAIANVLAALQEAATQAGSPDLTRAVAHIGLAGVMNSADSEAIAAALPFGQVTVSDDRATSVAGALGDSDGILAAIGTGTIVAAQDKGTVRYFGGWGHQLADQGSGGWLGYKALRCAVRAYDGLEPHSELTRNLLNRFGGTPVGFLGFVKDAGPKDFAALAPMVLDAAAADDPHATALMRAGVEYLMSCLRAVNVRPGTRLCLSGGIGPRYAPYLDPAVRSGLEAPQGTALDGAVRLARRLLQAEVSNP